MELWLRVMSAAALMGVCTAISYGYTRALKRLRERRIRDKKIQLEMLAKLETETGPNACQHRWKFEDYIMYPKSRRSYVYRCSLCGKREIRESAEDFMELSPGRIYELPDDGRIIKQGKSFAYYRAKAVVDGNGNTVIQNSEVKIK